MTRVLVAAVLAFCLAAPAQAAPITYALADYPELQNGLVDPGAVFHLAGQITTNGTMGPIRTADILSWEFSLFDSLGTTLVTVHSTDPNAITVLRGATATPTQILGEYTSVRANFPTLALATVDQDGVALAEYDLLQGAFLGGSPVVFSSGILNGFSVWDNGFGPPPSFHPFPPASKTG